MPRAVSFAIRVCMALAVLCFVGGLAFVAAAFVVSTESALAARPFVLKWFGFLLFAVLAGYVLVYHATTQDITPRQANTLAFVHCPPGVKRASYVLMVLGAAAFFGFIALVEAGRVARPVGESAILGSFAVTASAGVFARLWSTLVRISGDA